MRNFGVSLLTFLLTSSLSGAGTLGTVESEIESLESEISQAQNARDRVLLDPKASSDKAALKAKEDALAEKKAALATRLRELHTRPKAKPMDPRDYRPPPPDANVRDDGPEGFEQAGSLSPAIAPASENTPRAADAPPKEQTVLSGDGVKGEITYSKKKKGLPAKAAPASPAVVTESTPVPQPSGTPTSEGGQSEIQYPKKKATKKPTLAKP